MFSDDIMVWYKNPAFLSVSAGILTAVITAITPYAASSAIIGAAVTFGGLLLSVIKSEEAAPSPSPAPLPSPITPAASIPPAAGAAVPVPPTYSQGGQAVQYNLYSALGTTETINGATYIVGQRYNGADSGSGDAVPNGAYYLGRGIFGINGNYID